MDVGLARAGSSFLSLFPQGPRCEIGDGRFLVGDRPENGTPIVTPSKWTFAVLWMLSTMKTAKAPALSRSIRHWQRRAALLGWCPFRRPCGGEVVGGPQIRRSPAANHQSPDDFHAILHQRSDCHHILHPTQLDAQIVAGLLDKKAGECAAGSCLFILRPCRVRHDGS